MQEQKKTRRDIGKQDPQNITKRQSTLKEIKEENEQQSLAKLKEAEDQLQEELSLVDGPSEPIPDSV